MLAGLEKCPFFAFEIDNEGNLIPNKIQLRWGKMENFKCVDYFQVEYFQVSYL